MNSYKFKTQPFAHQSTVLKECWDRENWALFLDMGTGKSKICITCGLIVLLMSH